MRGQAGRVMGEALEKSVLRGEPCGGGMVAV